MATVAFIGLGNMGYHMARNLAKAGHRVIGSDAFAAAVGRYKDAGGETAGSNAAAVKAADVVVTMLPAGPEVAQVYDADVLANARPGTLLIDSSTIDVDTARAVAAKAEAAGFAMIDAPVSGGVGGAEAGTLTFMCGGPDAAFERARPFLDAMGKTIVLTGGAGNGQAAKVCNNMILAISMIGVCEAYAMAEKLGLDHQKLFDITSKSSGQCWAISNYCPVPGPVPASPANRDYQAGFTAAMMLKDLKLSQAAAASAGQGTALGAHAAQLFDKFVESGGGPLDFSGIYRMIRGN